MTQLITATLAAGLMFTAVSAQDYLTFQGPLAEKLFRLSRQATGGEQARTERRAEARADPGSDPGRDRERAVGRLRVDRCAVRPVAGNRHGSGPAAARHRQHPARPAAQTLGKRQRVEHSLVCV